MNTNLKIWSTGGIVYTFYNKDASCPPEGFQHAIVEVDFVNVSVGELGFKDGTDYQRLCAKAQEYGLQLCPKRGRGRDIKFGRSLRREDSWLHIAREDEVDPFITTSQDTCLIGHDGSPNAFYDADDRFIFVKPR